MSNFSHQSDTSESESEEEEEEDDIDASFVDALQQKIENVIET